MDHKEAHSNLRSWGLQSFHNVYCAFRQFKVVGPDNVAKVVSFLSKELPLVQF